MNRSIPILLLFFLARIDMFFLIVVITNTHVKNMPVLMCFDSVGYLADNELLNVGWRVVYFD